MQLGPPFGGPFLWAEAIMKQMELSKAGVYRALAV